MCAIAGIVGELNPESELVAAKMLASMKHRGPDYSDVRRVTDYVVFGHNRLSIIDLNVSANQPFVTTDGRYTIIFNGEIYNYKELKNQFFTDFLFRTNSDTEVLLAAYCKWGSECLDHLIGMFSFAIWDSIANIMFAARDRFGVKPFYYTWLGNRFTFASEIKALWAAGVGRLRNQKVWASYFVYGSYGMPDETFWNNIHQLPAGCFLILDQGRLKIKRWYHFEDRVKNIQSVWRQKDETVLTECYVQLMKDSTALRFRADVPVGFNLSGGLDSSLLLAIVDEVQRETKKINAFTFTCGDERYDELPWVISLLGESAHPLIECRLASTDVPTLTAEVSKHQDEPFGGIPTLAYSQVFKKARELGILVLLDGQGIDEAWAGYDYYQTQNGSLIQGVTSSPLRPEVLSLDFKKMAEQPQYLEPFDDNLLNLQYRDLFYTKIPRALRFNDRVSMQYSTELREPFLDHRLVEMAFSLPKTWKIKNSIGKYQLRKIAGKLLPADIRLAPKRPVQTPQREWLSNDLIDWVETQILIFSNQPFVEKAQLKEQWREYKQMKGDNSFFIWQWISSSII
jgi:asparagine synthase (glutamine-hydrolysing)